MAPDAVGRLGVTVMRWWHERLCERAEQRRRERAAAARRR